MTATPLSEDPEQIQLQNEVTAYKAMHPRLLTQFLGHWVAIHQGRLIDHDPDEDTLMKRLAQQLPANPVLVRQVEAESDHDVYIPSFRLTE